MRQRRGAYAPEFRQQMVDLGKAGRKPSDKWLLRMVFTSTQRAVASMSAS
jgi:hypothetical protein